MCISEAIRLQRSMQSRGQNGGFEQDVEVFVLSTSYSLVQKSTMNHR